MLWHEAKNKRLPSKTRTESIAAVNNRSEEPRSKNSYCIYVVFFFPPLHNSSVLENSVKKAQWSVIGRAVNDFRQRLVG